MVSKEIVESNTKFGVTNLIVTVTTSDTSEPAPKGGNLAGPDFSVG